MKLDTDDIIYWNVRKSFRYKLTSNEKCINFKLMFITCRDQIYF